MDVCEDATILCPHGCGKTVVRRDVERHLADNPTVHELASTRSLKGVVSHLVERVDGMETKIDTLLVILTEIRRLEEEKRALAVAEEVIKPLFLVHMCTQCGKTCTTVRDQTCRPHSTHVKYGEYGRQQTAQLETTCVVQGFRCLMTAPQQGHGHVDPSSIPRTTAWLTRQGHAIHGHHCSSGECVCIATDVRVRPSSPVFGSPH